jgi:hypothetical protein
MALSQQEQRLRSELSRIKAALQTKLGNRAVAKRLAESPKESPAKRSEARAKFNALNTEIAATEKQIAKLEESVKKERNRKEAIEIKSNYDRLKNEYDLLIDKTSPQAKSLAARVNSEVVKLNNAYKNSGSATRVKPVSTQAAPASKAQTAAEKSKAELRATKTAKTTKTPTAPTKTSTASTTATASTSSTAKTEDTAKTDSDKKKKTKDELYAEAIDTASKLYNMPDIIFKNVTSLGNLLQRYINDELTDAQFRRELQNDPWYRQNSAEIKARYVQLFNYQDLVKSGQAKGTTDYEQQIARIAKNIQAKARQLRGAEIDEADAKLLAQDMYIYNLDGDDAALTERLARFIRPVAGMVRGEPTIGYGGQALQNYQTLQALAKANGFKLEDILPRDAAGNAMTAESTLQALATNKLDINRVAQDVRKLAATGQPEYVRNLLGQGYDLEQVYQPYKSRMAAVLEIDPNTINLNDPALRGAITDKGDINLYDYDRMLRKDSRWQFTNQAREEVSNSVLQVLRDFGFMG